MRAIILPLLLLPFATPVAAASDMPVPGFHLPDLHLPDLHLSAAVNASTSTVINGIVFNRPQFGANVEGHHGNVSFEASIASAYSGGNNGTDHQDKYIVAYYQRLKPFNLKYEVMLKTYPGTRAGLNNHGIDYAVTASHSVKGVNFGLGFDYTNKDYSTTRKSYGINLSLGHSFMSKLSGWLSVSHHHQFGSVDYTNTNMGLYYQLSSKFGVSTSINNWHAYADWNHDRPTLSISLSRKL